MPRETWTCWLILCPGENCWDLLVVPAEPGSEEAFVVCECGYRLTWAEARDRHVRDADAASAARKRGAAAVRRASSRARPTRRARGRQKRRAPARA